MHCSRTQHGLTREGLEPPTSGSGVRGINHQATALPYIISFDDGNLFECISLTKLRFITDIVGFILALRLIKHDMLVALNFRVNVDLWSSDFHIYSLDWNSDRIMYVLFKLF